MRLNPRITTTALAAALALSAAPAAAGATSSTSPAVLPNPDEQMLTSHVAIAAAAPSAGSGSGSGSAPTPADLAAAQLAATRTSAPLYQFGLIHIHSIPPITVTATTHPDGFQYSDAVIGAGAMARPLNRPLAPNRASASPCSEICSGGPAPSTASTGPGSEVIDNGGYGFSNAPATVVRVTTPRGFDWGDAGIGAAGAVGLALSALGVALAVSQRRARRSKEPTAVTS